MTSFVLPDAEVVMYTHLAKLKRIEGYAAWLDARQGQLARHLGPVEERCGFDPVEATDRWVITETQDRMLLAAHLLIPAEKVLACARALGEDEAENTTIAGHEGVKIDTVAAVTLGDVLLLGNADLVERAARDAQELQGARVPWLPDLRATTAYTRFSLGGAGGLESVGTRLQERDGVIQLSIDYTAESVIDADIAAEALRLSLEPEMKRALDEAQPKNRKRIEERWRRAVTRRRVGQRCEVVFPTALTDDDAAAQEHLGRRLMESILRHRATEMARETLRDLAMRLKQHALDHPMLGKPAFPTSAPLTPSSIAHGLDAVSREADWAHPVWEELEFSGKQGDLFSYAVDSSPTRRTASVRAVADLDGDGRETVMRIELEVDTSGQVLVGDVDTVQP